MKKHYTIPFFITHKGCPFTCIFCRQDRISGRERSITPEEITPVIEKYLKTIPRGNARIEAAFFGGSFTGLPLETQKRFLGAARPFLEKGAIDGVRLSTRPDFIDANILKTLKEYGVKRVELGVQSMSDEILSKAKRGHSRKDIEEASGLILKHKMALGHQIMVGLPGSTFKDELDTAVGSVKMGATEVRIYPVIVIRGTELADMWREGAYEPLSEEEAIKRCSRLVRFFRKHGVEVIRCGLHPSEGLISGRDMLAGPFHQAFGQKVETRIYLDLLKDAFDREKGPEKVREIQYNPIDGPSVIGHGRINADYVEKLLNREGVFRPSGEVRPGTIRILYKNGQKALCC
jgi:histone acetyltransferase (RNA polymerase elongator complex component)